MIIVYQTIGVYGKSRKIERLMLRNRATETEFSGKNSVSLPRYIPDYIGTGGIFNMRCTLLFYEPIEKADGSFQPNEATISWVTTVDLRLGICFNPPPCLWYNIVVGILRMP